MDTRGFHPPVGARRVKLEGEGRIAAPGRGCNPRHD